MFVLLISLFIILCGYVTGSCPKLCDQYMCTAGVLLCSQSGLRVLPDTPPQGITNVTIINQIFPKPVLAYRNLSKYGPEDISLLKHLTIRHCGLVDIESESFSHLIHLVDLDLSGNDLRIVRPRSFKALSLKLLKLDGNMRLQLDKDSLEGLVVSVLSLANCGLTQLNFYSIREISGQLTSLILSGNKLKTISFRFVLLFRRLEVLRLENNQLKCDCKLRWLSSILVKLQGTIHTKDISATCHTPLELTGRSISSIPESMFECFLPTLEKISVHIETAKSATLSCQATTQSEAIVYWNNKNTNNTVNRSVNRAYIHIRGSKDVDQYSCYAVNDHGNVTVDLNIQWPPPIIKVSKVLPPLSSDKSVSVPSNSNEKNVQYLLLRQFSLWELLLSVATTFVITIVLFTLIYICLARRLHLGKEHSSLTRSGYEGGIYADIPVYDVPHVYSSRTVYPSSPGSLQNAQLIDFKTQRLIGTNRK